MILTLSIRNPESLGDAGQPEFKLARRDAMIGRSKTCDWSLPDDKNFISTRHCQISFRDDAYFLKDISTNGTMLNGATGRMTEERRIENGDLFQIGPYQVLATVGADTAETTLLEPAGAVPAVADHENVTMFGGSIASTWSRNADGSLVSSEMAAPAAAPAPAPPPPPPPSPPAASAEPSSAPAASTEPERPRAPASAEEEDAPSEAFTRFISQNDIDWMRGGFGGDAPPQPARTGEAAAPEELVQAFVEGAGLKREDIASASLDLMSKAGGLFRRLVSGMVVMVEARARAKSQMGAESTSLQVEGNNPIKFARTPDQAIKQLLNPKARGFMEAENAIEDGFVDLQSHQAATLAAIPGSLKMTLERFSPGSIKRRAENMGILSRIIPAARDAALWNNYEREFAKVAAESDEAFLEVFAKEFRKAYDKQLRKMQEQQQAKK
jgi:type VI secretion system protein